MARRRLDKRKRMKRLIAFFYFWSEIVAMVTLFMQFVISMARHRHMRALNRPKYTLSCSSGLKFMRELVYDSDITCHNYLRMDRASFTKLCDILHTTGKLSSTKYLQIDEQVAIFLYVLAHHVKNRVIVLQFRRSGETISRHFNNVLNAVIRLEGQLFKKPEPIRENSTDDKWKWFKVFL